MPFQNIKAIKGRMTEKFNAVSETPDTKSAALKGYWICRQDNANVDSLYSLFNLWTGLLRYRNLVVRGVSKIPPFSETGLPSLIQAFFLSPMRKVLQPAASGSLVLQLCCRKNSLIALICLEKDLPVGPVPSPLLAFGQRSEVETAARVAALLARASKAPGPSDYV